MSTTTYSSNNSDSNDSGGAILGFLFLVGIIIIGCILWNPVMNLYKDLTYTIPPGTIIMISNVQQNSGHGFKHGIESIIIDECIEKNGAMQTWLNKTNGHKINLICFPQVDGTFQFGIQVLNRIERKITSYIKDPERYKTIEEVIKYLERSGYEFYR